MIALVANVYPINRGLDVTYIEVEFSDASPPKAEARDSIFAGVKNLKHKVGMVVRQFGGNDYLTCAPVNRAQMESQLLGAAVAKAMEVHVDGVNVEAKT